MQVVILGSSSHVPTAERDNVGLLVNPEAERILVDCPGAIAHKLKRAGVDPRDVTDVVLTHDHADHLYGLPSLVHCQLYHPHPIRLHAPAPTLATAARLIQALELDESAYPQLEPRPILAGERAPFAKVGRLELRALRVDHPRETAAIRVDEEGTGLAFVHSSDTRRYEPLAGFARGAHTLIHDCAGPERFGAWIAEVHTTARQAGEIARESGVTRLVLTHLHMGVLDFVEDEVRTEAEGEFGGEVVVARDEMILRF